MHIKKYWHTALLCSLTIALSIDTFAQQTGTPVLLQSSSELRSEDNMESQLIRMSHPAIAFDWLPLANWAVSSQREKGISAQYVYQSFPSLKLQLIVYPQNSWLSDMSPESINEYIQALPKQFPNNTIKLLNEGQHKPPIGSVPFLGRGFRKVFYTVTPKQPQLSSLSIYDFWTVTEDGVLVIARYKGDQSIPMKSMSPMFERELAQFILSE